MIDAGGHVRLKGYQDTLGGAVNTADKWTTWVLLAVKKWWTWVILIAVIGALFAWFTRDQLPEPIRIATADEKGLYHKFGVKFKRALDTKLGVPLDEENSEKVVLVPTEGSAENGRLLKLDDDNEGHVDLAIIQAGTVPMDEFEIAGVVPLFPDVVHFVVRSDIEITSAEELYNYVHENDEWKVLIGSGASGMKKSAQAILPNLGFDITDPQLLEKHFDELPYDENYVAAVVTTGVLNPALKELLGSNDYKLLTLNNPSIVTLNHAYLNTYTIPKDFYSLEHHIPSTEITTVATTAYLAVRRDAPDQLVQLALEALYENELRADEPYGIPVLIAKEDAQDWKIFPKHAASERYFDPYKGLDLLGKFVSFITGAKELVFSAFAGLYLLMRRRKRIDEIQKEQEVHAQHALLDKFLKATFEIERRQMEERSPEKLALLLHEVTRTKLAALEELTNEELRGDRRFLIFLAQCDTLSLKIQTKQTIYSK